MRWIGSTARLLAAACLAAAPLVCCPPRIRAAPPGTAAIGAVAPAAAVGSRQAGACRPVALVLAIAALSLVFAKAEIHIEGGAGWAGNLPTWRIEKHPLLDIFWGGRPITGYHLWVFLFMLLAFHLPFAVCAAWSVRLEARVIGSLMLFWIAEDFLWFVMNPAFGVRRLRRQFVPWHTRWIGPVPLDYVLFGVAGTALLYYSFAG